MSRFPFEEDFRHRFGEFQEWTGRYLFIGRCACSGPQPRLEPTVLQPLPRVRRYRLSATRPTAAPGEAFTSKHQQG